MSMNPTNHSKLAQTIYEFLYTECPMEDQDAEATLAIKLAVHLLDKKFATRRARR